MSELGRVCEVVRYPVKSMAGIAAASCALGRHGLAGDRRYAFRRPAEAGGIPWLTASRLPELLLYHPDGLDERAGESLPTHVRTPAGARLELHGPELRTEISERSGVPVELVRHEQGIFDDGSVSVIGLPTIAGIGRAAGMDLDRRRFRANLVIETHGSEPFLEDAWVGGVLVFGDGPSPAVLVTKTDERCRMINLDPDTAEQDPRVLKAVVKLNANRAGVYGVVARPGVVRVGQVVRWVPDVPR